MEDVQTTISELLDACIRGESLSSDQLSALERRSDLPSYLASTVHELHHFADDADIRAADPGHAEYWRSRLLEIRDRIARSA
mgnify:FL=1